MITLHDSLSTIERLGASAYGDTHLARGHAAVTRRVRRARTTQASVGAVAVAGLLGGVGYGLSQWAPSPNVAPAAPSTGDNTTAPTAPGVPPVTAVTIFSNSSLESIAETLAPLYGVSTVDAAAAIADAVRAAVPQATTAEGWVKPGQYTLEPGSTLKMAAGALVGVRVAEFRSLGIPGDQWQDVLTEASLVSAETQLSVDMPKVARVIQNRLDQGMKLELDSPVKYIAPSGSVFTSDEDRAIDSPYNTYRYTGLPPAAIGSPADDAVDAVLHPADGDWLFFVTVNLDTGEMLFASTFEEHQANVMILQQWIKDNSTG